MKKIILYFVGSLTRLHILTPIRVARLKFWYKMHRWPDFEHPRDLNEKINYLKFYTDTTAWSRLSDKYAVREFVSGKGLEDTLVGLIGKWDCVADIAWESLPQQFVMKCNNGSGDVVICRDRKKLDIVKAQAYFAKTLSHTFGELSGEPHYAPIKPCIVVEELLDASTQPCHSSSLIDYKIWCFDGKPAYTWCCCNRHQYHAEVGIYDMEWNYRPELSVFTDHYREARLPVPKPSCFDHMMEVASRLSAGFPQLRVDLYEVNGHVYFGELTFSSQGGYMDFYTQDFLNELGDRCDLSACCRRSNQSYEKNDFDGGGATGISQRADTTKSSQT